MAVNTQGFFSDMSFMIEIYNVLVYTENNFQNKNAFQ